MSNKPALAPCPFCGSAASFYPDGDEEGHSVICEGGGPLFDADATKCPMATFGYATEDAAREAWNRRAPAVDAPAPAAPDAAIALLRRMLDTPTMHAQWKAEIRAALAKVDAVPTAESR